MLLLNSLKYLFIMGLLVFLQVAIFNNIDFWGYANPYFYLIFILLLPFSDNKFLVLLLAFILGLSIDFLENTGGVNAFASVFVAYIRYFIVGILTANSSKGDDELHLSQLNLVQWILYLAIMIFIHHFLVDFLESFKFSMAGNIAIKSILGSVITFILISGVLFFIPISNRNEY
ncbi:MAG: rod shape-determining protein MreD [Flavobacteriaceae bacterium]|nr:rod shape-determining protein MreD [Flavobacteriaceae bacterium]